MCVCVCVCMCMCVFLKKLCLNDDENDGLFMASHLLREGHLRSEVFKKEFVL